MSSTLHITLPDEIRAWLEQHADGDNDAGEFVIRVLREEQIRQARANVDAQLLQGLDSPTSPMQMDDWESLQSDARRRWRYKNSTRPTISSGVSTS